MHLDSRTTSGLAGGSVPRHARAEVAELADDLNVTGDTCAEDGSALLGDHATRPWSADPAVERRDAMERNNVAFRFVAFCDDLVVLGIARRKEAQSRHVALCR